MTTQQLRAAIEREKTAHFWGEDYQVTPRFCPTVLGDGKQLLWVQPLATRPDYYVIRVDCRWLADDTIADHDEEIYDAIEAEYGYDDDRDDAGNHLPFPALNLSCGVSWGPEEWPDSEGAKR